jgi:hypothetical protein
MFVKSMLTFPALAVNEVVSYFSWPCGLEARLKVCPALAPPVAGAGAEEVAELVVGAAALLLVVAAEELLLGEELPHPASASSPAASASIEIIDSERVFTRPAA